MYQAVLEKQSYMLIGRYDIENLMKRDPASACLPNSLGQPWIDTDASDAKSAEVEMEISDLLLSLRPIKQVNYCKGYVVRLFIVVIIGFPLIEEATMN